MRRSFLKKVVMLTVVVGYLASLFFTVDAFATTNIFKVDNAEITELSATAEGTVSVVDDANLSSNITFKTVGDEAKLKITLKNEDSKEHTIESISDDNASPYIILQYDSYANLSVAAGESFDFLVTMKYQTAVVNANDRAQTSNTKFSIKYFDVEDQDIIPIVPNTGAGITAPKNESAIKSSVIALVVATISAVICAVIIIKNHKKFAKVVTVVAILATATTMAAAVKAATIVINNIFVTVSYTISDEVVSYDITSDAVKNYYASVNTWLTSQDTYLTAMKNNYDSNSCKATTLNPQTSTDFPTEYKYATNGTVPCDKPKGYDTGTADIKVYLSDETQAKGAEATYVSINNGVITNMIPGITYYWESTTDPTVHGFVKATGDRRLIDLPTARNVRDLGGIKGADGKSIKYGRLLRGERLGDNDVAALDKLGIDKEYDVRSEDNGSHFVNGYERHAMMNYDILDNENYAGAREALTSLMRDIIAGNSIYFHCTHGSDRTGTLAYLAETLLGVSREDRDRDFDLTALSGRPDRTRFYDHMEQSSPGFNRLRKYVYMTTELPDEAAVRAWYLSGSEDLDADKALITSFQNAILE